jgi:iron complex transport system substrate-binding protein
VVLERAPDALLMVRGGKMTLPVLQDRPGWSSMRAIKEHRIYFVDDRIYQASPIAIDALEDLAKQFHP